MSAERVKTGIADLDVMLAGGVQPGGVNLVKGSPGTGKTTIGLEFIVRGIKQFGEPGLIVTFEQFPEQIQRDALSIGFDLAALEADGLLKVIFSSPATINAEIARVGGILDETVVKMGVKRIFIDSMSHLERLVDDGHGLREVVYSFINGLKRFGATILLTQEDSAITGELMTTDYGLSYMVDTIIQLRYVELDSAMAKALFVLKHRASDHDKTIRQYYITDKGIALDLPFKDRQGLLSGNASLNPERAFFKAFGGKK